VPKASAHAVGSLLLTAAALGLAVSGASVLYPGQKKTSLANQQGRTLFAQHCVSCHGASGLGDGPAAAALKVPPGDLTKISKKYNGFPKEKVMDWIDGEKYAVGHGGREMPVWGKRFRRDQSSTQEASSEVRALANYLESIQKPK
jgi:mono/diheme cytochrome c family protein